MHLLIAISIDLQLAFFSENILVQALLFILQFHLMRSNKRGGFYLFIPIQSSSSTLLFLTRKYL